MTDYMDSHSILEDFTSAYFPADVDGKCINFGGQYVPEILMNALNELEEGFKRYICDADFRSEFNQLLNEFVGRPSPLTKVDRFAKKIHQKWIENLNDLAPKKLNIYLKREDLNHTGAHKINNALGQALIAKRLGKTRIIAETGAGQHGVATATVCALLGLECEIYMGEIDAKRQSLNVARMRLLGAKVNQVKVGDKILKDAINEALRDWVTNIETTHYLLGTVAGPHPYPKMVREFQKVISIEAKEQFKKIKNDSDALPDYIFACIGGGSNAMGIWNEFLNEPNVQLWGIEAGGEGLKSGKHAIRFTNNPNFETSPTQGSIGVFQGALSYLLQNKDGQTMPTHSISAGLDYASIGPQHCQLKHSQRAKYSYATDQEAMEAFRLLSTTQGIIPAIESSHALAGAIKELVKISDPRDEVNVIINLSGRGDKDMDTAINYFTDL